METTHRDNESSINSFRYYGRKFRVLLIPGGMWLCGKVLGFKKTRNAKNESFTLIAEMEPAGSYRKGVLVRRGGRIALVVQGTENATTCSLLHSDGHCTKNACTSHYNRADGMVEFTIKSMNVQGGGLVTAEQLGLGDTMLSFEWLESAKPKRDGDLSDAPTLEPAWKDTIHRDRCHSYAQFMIQFKEQRQTVDVYTAGKQFYLSFMPSGLNLRCVPMVLFPHIMAVLLRQMGHADRNTVQSMTHALFDVFHDKAWTSQCTDLVFLCADSCPKMNAPSSEKRAVDNTMWMSMWNALFLLSQWYSQIDDNETALRHLQEAVEWVQSADCLTEERAEYFLSIASHNLACGYMAVGHITAAFENLERAIQLCPIAEDRVRSIREARRLRLHAQSWIGTSGTLTPFETQPPTIDKAFDVCCNCGRSKPIHVCAGCGMTSYCGSECQAVHWKAVHRHTCFFLPEQATDELKENRCTSAADVPNKNHHTNKEFDRESENSS
eukprot:scaffold771_cov170-Amphora_coffeaeformis.AAC.13